MVGEWMDIEMNLCGVEVGNNVLEFNGDTRKLATCDIALRESSVKAGKGAN